MLKTLAASANPKFCNIHPATRYIAVITNINCAKIDKGKMCIDCSLLIVNAETASSIELLNVIIRCLSITDHLLDLL